MKWQSFCSMYYEKFEIDIHTYVKDIMKGIATPVLLPWNYNQRGILRRECTVARIFHIVTQDYGQNTTQAVVSFWFYDNNTLHHKLFKIY